MSETNWLQRKDFIMHSGRSTFFKIEEEALTYEEIEAFALLIARKHIFSDVYGIPRGGLRIAKALRKHTGGLFNMLLIVDDVFTTGASMEKARRELSCRGITNVMGIVLFSRGKCPSWIHPVFQLWETL